MKMICDCGNSLSDKDPDVQLWVYNAWHWELICELINSYDTSLRFLPHPKNTVWRCPECERMYFFEGTKVIKTYVLDPEPQVKTPGENSA
jgi:hypothetical protein